MRVLGRRRSATTMVAMTEVPQRPRAATTPGAGGEQGKGPGMPPAASGKAPRRDYCGPGRCIGVWDPPGEVHPLSLHVTGPVSAELWRHRFNPRNGSSLVAKVEHAEGRVGEVAWDAGHRRSAPQDWRGRLEGWIAAKIAADWAEQS